ncbi:MAG: tetratricopeptide repeat protein [Flavipsychrobacter sp.]
MLLGIFWMTIQTSVAQEEALTKARIHVLSQEYKEAESIYKKLYKKNPLNKEIYTEYFQLLLKTKEYKRAEKLVTEQLTIRPNHSLTTIDLGLLYKAQGKKKKAEELFEQAITELTGDDLLTQEVAKAFLAIKEKELALKTYERGKEMLHNNYIYSGPIARLYAEAGDMEKAVYTIIDAGSGYYSGGIQEVKASIMDLLEDDRKKIVKAQKAIIKKINEQPDNLDYSEILVWLYTQKEDWEGAYIQIKALDLRLKDGGERILNFARYAVKEKEYEYARKAYEEVISRGEDYSFHTSVKNEYLLMQFKMLEENPDYTEEDTKQLSAQYASFLQENPLYIAQLISLDYAKLLAQYIDSVHKAIQILEEAIEHPNSSRQFKALAKLQLGDYKILVDEIWEASLLYSQVDKAFREDMQGEEARFRNAKLAYYRGDFEWAETQLSVLKASTTELIANDALYLSVLITENIPPDSNYVPLRRFAYADLLQFQNKDEEAAALLDSINTAFPDHPLKDDILMQRANIAQKHRQYKEALEYLTTIYEQHGDDVLGDDALFKMADLYENKLDNKTKAAELYEQLILQYPGSTYVQTARDKVKQIAPNKSS